jgi:hypothetical protein
MSGLPKSCSDVQQGRTAGLPKGRETYGDGAPIAVAGVTTCQGVRESRTQGKVAQVTGLTRYVRSA